MFLRALIVGGIVGAPAMALANEAAAAAPAPATQEILDVLWLVLAAMLVFFMQAGFAMLESGLTRAKSTVNILTKNLLDFSLGCLVFWAFGYALMYGADGLSIVGWSTDLLFMDTIAMGEKPSEAAGWFFQMVFAATAATIVSGAVAERTKLIGYLFFSVLITGLIYPVAGHWFWASDGWLNSLGVRDFAGSGVVHALGGFAALAGSWVVGARTGKFRRSGKPNVIPGHSVPMAALGTFILWFGWFGFNAGSTLAATSGIAHVVVTTTLSASAGAIAALVTSWFRFGKPDLTMALNGCLGGLVGITAGCASVSAPAAVLIGIAAGLFAFYATLFVERKLKIDDPVGAVAVHGVCGVWGVVAIGLFGQRAIDIRYWDEATAISDGLLYGGGFSQLGVQSLAALVVIAYSFGVSVAAFKVLNHFMGIRVSPEQEMQGLDIVEHGMTAYPNFEVAHGRLPQDPVPHREYAPSRKTRPVSI